MSNRDRTAERYARVAASAPVNAAAARAVSMTGDIEPAPKLTEGQKHWEAPPRTIPIPAHQPQFMDLTGRTIGRCTVVGYLGPGRVGSRWLVRCLCGRYEARKAKAITRRAPSDAPDQCARCNHLHRIQRQHHFDTKGCWPDEGR
jgi:hypothetical protein